MNKRTWRTATIATGTVMVVAALAFLLVRMASPAGWGVADARANGYAGQPRLGSPQAQLKVILYENFLCEHCRAFEEDVLPEFQRRYVETGRVELYFVALAWGDGATAPALAGECAFRQDEAAFWEYKTRLFDRQDTLADATPEALASLASGVAGVDAADLAACVRDGATRSEVQRDLDLADYVGIRGTPTVVVGSQAFEAPSLATLADAVEAASQD